MNKQNLFFIPNSGIELLTDVRSSRQANLISVYKVVFNNSKKVKERCMYVNQFGLTR